MSAACTDAGLAFYPSAHDRVRLPETVQSPCRTPGGGTFSVAVAIRDPSQTVRAARVRRSPRAAYAGFSTAPAGTIPSVTYRHNAMTSLRATATIPIFRARAPVPKRV